MKKDSPLRRRERGAEKGILGVLGVLTASAVRLPVNVLPEDNRIMDMNKITEQIIGAAIEVHRVLGPGLLESTYEGCLCRELDLRSIPYQRQRALPVEYKGTRVECGYRLDLVVLDAVVVEIKAVSTLEPIHEAQLLTYLRLGGWHVGLLINFNVPVLKRGVKRMVNELNEKSASSAPPR